MYGWELKATECPTCGGPVILPIGPVQVQCDDCGGPVELGERKREPSSPAEVDEGVRIARLFAQVESFDPKGPLVAWLPTELQRYELMIAQPATRDAGIAGLRREWSDARRAMEDEGDGEAATRLFRIGQGLGRTYALEIDDHARSRAILETALDLLPDRAQRDMVRCRLARHALRAGDEDAHAAWLSDCHPAPTALEVDGELRSTRALAAYRHQDWNGVLEALGPSHRAVPLAFPIAPLGLCLRAHALAGLGDHDAARAEIRHLSASVPMGYVRAKQTWARHPGPSSEYAIAVARKASPTPTPRSQPAARPSAPPRQRRWWWPFGS